MSQNDHIILADKIRKAWTQKKSFIFPLMTIEDLSCILDIIKYKSGKINL